MNTGGVCTFFIYSFFFLFFFCGREGTAVNIENLYNDWRMEGAPPPPPNAPE